MSVAPTRRRAFTLIELLVTISIIGILVALVTPAIVSASTKGDEVKCLANARSIGQATAAYTADHDRRFPAAPGHNLNLLNLAGKRGTNGTIGAIEAEDRLLYDYLNQQTDVAECPLDKGFDNYASAFDGYGSSYLYMRRNNDNYTDFRTRNGVWALENHRVNEVIAPAKKMVIGEATLIRDDSNSNHHWHNDQANLMGTMAFVDGHVAVVTHKTNASGSYVRYTNKNTINQWAKEDLYY